jgi:hypothetical protein
VILGQLDDADEEMSARDKSRSFRGDGAAPQRRQGCREEDEGADADHAEADRAAAEKGLVAAK